MRHVPDLARRQWLEPQADWLPLAQAVFKFGVADDRDPNAIHEKPQLELKESEIAEGSVRSFSLGELATMLKEKTGAYDAGIDLNKGTFSFSFLLPSGRASYLFGPPWAILGEARDTAPSADVRLDAEALFKKEGFVRVSDEEAARNAKQLDAVRKATGLVWRQFMLRAFDHAVSAKAIVVYARIQTSSAPFEQLPADVWPVLDVVDWLNGVAVAPDHPVYWSVHVSRSPARPGVAKSAASRQPARERARRAIAALYPNGMPDQAIEPNATLCRKVGAWLTKNRMPDANNDTILRAAGRRK